MKKLITFAAMLGSAFAAAPFVEKADIFPLSPLHNHASSIVELPDGSLMVCWYRGSGERTADDVAVMGARKVRASKEWSAPFVLADTVGFPDTNPMVFVDRNQRLWLFWNTIVANRWETAILNYKRASQAGTAGAPAWDKEGYIVPKPANLAARVQAYANMFPALKQHKDWPDLERMSVDKFALRMGWMTRAHPTQLPSGRLLLPLYSDGYNFSLVAISDDGGDSWFMSEPIVGMGGVQPSIVQRNNGALIAYMRDNGPAPKRVQSAVSGDEGLTWSFSNDEAEPNSGTGLEVLKLRGGRWLLINNDTERGRNSLTLALSDDEGKTWKWRRRLEYDPKAEKPDSFHYPSLWQSADGSIHASYSVFLNSIPEGRPRKTIRYARFNTEWIMQGEQQ